MLDSAMLCCFHAENRHRSPESNGIGHPQCGQSIPVSRGQQELESAGIIAIGTLADGAS
jgi:hypothetical protein